MGALAHEPTTVRGVAIGVPYSVQVVHTSIPRLANCMRGHQVVPPSRGKCIVGSPPRYWGGGKWDFQKGSSGGAEKFLKNQGGLSHAGGAQIFWGGKSH